MPDNLWSCDIVNFTLLGAGYFYIPVKNFEFSSRTQLAYLEIVFSFWVLLLRFGGKDQNSV